MKTRTKFSHGQIVFGKLDSDFGDGKYIVVKSEIAGSRELVTVTEISEDSEDERITTRPASSLIEAI